MIGNRCILEDVKITAVWRNGMSEEVTRLIKTRCERPGPDTVETAPGPERPPECPLGTATRLGCASAISAEKIQAFQEGRAHLSPQEVAEYLGVHVNRIYELVKDHRLRATKVGRLLRFDYRDLKEFKERNGTRS